MKFLPIKLAFILFVLSVNLSNAQIITTVAGGGSSYNSGVPALDFSLSVATSVAADHKGNVYIASQMSHRIFKVDASGILTYFAGTGLPGFSGDGGQAISAQLYTPSDLAVDAVGNLYICDHNNLRIRKIDTNGIITTVAGNGTAWGNLQDDIPALSSPMGPWGIDVDNDGNLFIADFGYFCIRKVNTAGMISTVAGNGFTYVENGPAIGAKIQPSTVRVDQDGNLFFNDDNSYLRKVSGQGIITTIAGDSNTGYSGDGALAINAKLNLNPLMTGITTDDDGNIFFADTWNGRVRKIDVASGIITTVAGNGYPSNPPYNTGDGGPATSAICPAKDVAFNNGGDLYIAAMDRIRKISSGLNTQEINSKNGYFNIYPNPTAGHINISGILPGEDQVNISIIDLLGRKVSSSSYKISGGSLNTEIDVDVPAGIYFIDIAAKNFRKAQTLQKH